MFQQLNPQQRAAVQECGRPMLVLAGAGSGKTRVITYKIAWLLSRLGVDPRHIYAVTFTNKAAREMKERVTELLSADQTKGLTISTFHSLGMAILREEVDASGRKPGFSIFDPSDSLFVVRELLKADLDDNGLVDRVRNQISSWKNDLVSPEMAMQLSMTNPVEVAAAKVYGEYERYLQACNAVDLDDMLYLPNELMRKFDNVRIKWQARVQYMLVDEYQDTNAAQYRLVKTLVAGSDGNGLTAVGDDDQSIYAWRGAQPENLLQLQTDFPALELVKLEQNYRSMGRILALANHVIQNNPRPFDKNLWSDLGIGDPIVVMRAENDEREAEKVVAGLMQHRFQNQRPYSDYAILYRGNHQSRMLEHKLREMHIPYYLSGGLSFFDRSEIKDVMAYLRLVTNPADDNAFVRAINTPRRGIGSSSLEALAEAARSSGCSLYAAIQRSALHEHLSPSRQAPLRQFEHWLDGMIASAETDSPVSVINKLLEDIGYQEWIVKQSASPEQAEMRWRNVEDLLGWVKSIASKGEDRKLADVVSVVSLMGILEKNDDDTNSNVVSLMTLHASKGLEFPHVTIVGMEEEILPHRTSIEDDMVEEERRLFYVGITRAQRELVLSYANQRKRYGEVMQCTPSRFLDELDEQHIVWEEKLAKDPQRKEEVGQTHLAAMRALLG
ncbi:UvrD-helicase domain-containing protein [Arenicella xantha]|uniref:ATP-dependent DNA helicase Rep n=1 Tax=Arenicella xantha TaxID=644221 RepID=A0A395JPR3_9GAMM|nr:UvrD-helicase domain-containing protein [Arenicella xantha]RBP53333.1 ATP-dependent DNA helicase Rep [Arenicella xantha]